MDSGTCICHRRGPILLNILIFVIAIAGTAVLVFHITLEVNAIEKRVHEFIERVEKHYEPVDRT